MPAQNISVEISIRILKLFGLMFSLLRLLSDCFKMSGVVDMEVRASITVLLRLKVGLVVQLS